MKNGLSLLTLMLSTLAFAQGTTPTLRVPSGLQVNEFASGFNQPRFLAVAPGGDVFISERSAGNVVVLRDTDGDGRADRRSIYASGLNRPNGLAFHGGFLYVANTDSIVRFAYRSGDLRAAGNGQKIVDLPGGGLHSTRTVVFGPDNRMYVSIGSTADVGEETDPRRAAVWVYDADGKNGRVFASGLRNAVGLLWNRGTLYATNNERNALGGDLPVEPLFKLRAGAFYGWPYCYATGAGRAQVWDEDFGQRTAAVCRTAERPFTTFPAHTAPLGLTAYGGTVLPTAYRGQLFVALHGSYNEPQKVGYKVVMVDPQSGRTTDFVTGFLSGQTVLGRPVDLITAPDGSLLLTDDFGGRIWRISAAKP